MVPLTRGPTPSVLVENATRWKTKFVADHAAGTSRRPPNSQYGHDGVRVELRRMSGNKCFYCERKLTEPEQEVDHHIEVAEKPDLAFEWSNLYLACKPCNGKKAPNTDIPVVDCVDPCVPGAAPDSHLTFDQERIEARSNSLRGARTIKKYRLDRDDLDLARSRALNTFKDALIAVQQRQIADGRSDCSPEERDLLVAFRNAARPFSLMMATCLHRLGL